MAIVHINELSFVGQVIIELKNMNSTPIQVQELAKYLGNQFDVTGVEVCSPDYMRRHVSQARVSKAGAHIVAEQVGVEVVLTLVFARGNLLPVGVNESAMLSMERSHDPLTKLMLSFIDSDAMYNPDIFKRSAAMGGKWKDKEYNFRYDYIAGSGHITGNIEGVRIQVIAPLNQHMQVTVYGIRGTSTDKFESVAPYESSIERTGFDIWKRCLAVASLAN